MQKSKTTLPFLSPQPLGPWLFAFSLVIRGEDPKQTWLVWSSMSSSPMTHSPCWVLTWNTSIDGDSAVERMGSLQAVPESMNFLKLNHLSSFLSLCLPLLLLVLEVMKLISSPCTLGSCLPKITNPTASHLSLSLHYPVSSPTSTSLLRLDWDARMSSTIIHLTLYEIPQWCNQRPQLGLISLIRKLTFL